MRSLPAKQPSSVPAILGLAIVLSLFAGLLVFSAYRPSESKVRLFVLDPVSVPLLETRNLTTSKPISALDAVLNEPG